MPSCLFHASNTSGDIHMQTTFLFRSLRLTWATMSRLCLHAKQSCFQKSGTRLIPAATINVITRYLYYMMIKMTSI